MANAYNDHPTSMSELYLNCFMEHKTLNLKYKTSCVNLNEKKENHNSSAWQAIKRKNDIMVKENFLKC